MKIAVLLQYRECGVGRFVRKLDSALRKLCDVLELPEGDYWFRNRYLDVDRIAEKLKNEGCEVFMYHFTPNQYERLTSAFNNLKERVGKFCKFVIVVHGISRSDIHIRLIRKLRPDLCIGLTRDITKFLTDNGFRTFYVPHGCDPPIWYDKQLTKSILCYGLARKEKNFEFALSLRSYLRHYGMKVSIIPVRSRHTDKEYERRISDLGIRVRDFMSEEELRKTIMEHDIVIVPYKETNHYTASGVICDCASLTTPCICSNTIVTRQILEIDDRLWVELKLSKFYEAIKYVYSNYDEIRKKFYNYALERTWDKVAMKICEILEKFT